MILRDGSEIVRTTDNRALVMDADFSKEERTIPAATVFGGAVEIAEELVNKINPDDKPKSDLVNDRERKKRNEFLYRKIVLGKFDHLSEE